MKLKRDLHQTVSRRLMPYVVDDGWVDYKSGFWSFNKKFPNRLYDTTQLTSKIGSHFGLWLGPRGGYGRPDLFAKKMEKRGLGAYNAEAKDICIADKTYIKNVTDFILKSTQEFDIDYWKFDGFCLTPCKDANHNHPVGGEQDMYMITDMWQSWIEVFQKIRTLRKKFGKRSLVKYDLLCQPITLVASICKQHLAAKQR